MVALPPTASSDDVAPWHRDTVFTQDGIAIPVRQTARRPSWGQLPVAVRAQVEAAAGSTVTQTWSTGTGFTPGFASRVRLADGRDLFVKAASSVDDRLHGWALSDAYREEGRKLSLLGPAVGAPLLLWERELDLDGERWVLLGLEYVAGRPPRRPWRLHELLLVVDRLAQVAPAMACPPAQLGLGTVYDELVVDFGDRLGRSRELEGDTEQLDVVEGLCAEADTLMAGDSMVHMDLRDDNVLISDNGHVWFVDWNFPAIGAPWIDLVCILLSARGDRLDVDPILDDHVLSRGVDPHAIDVLLALLWSYWGIAKTEAVPPHSPHLRDHQHWYADVTQEWLLERLSNRGRRASGSSYPPRGRHT
ncbi:MAG: hypothetical protein QOI51_295 [Nocardioidaceae bacterium]|nr:hypothetical protein [Nocardioidaceae bacterium]